MTSQVLNNKPLVECILEIRWKLIENNPGRTTDPHFQLLLGRLYDRLNNDYPEHEQLPAATVPSELVGHTVLHRFRHTTDGWPLIQVGPGIMTVNDTDGYKWSDFRERSKDVKAKLFDAHPKPEDLKIDVLTLRYIDAVEMNYLEEDVLEFLKDKMGVNAALPANLFEETPVKNNPQSLLWQSTFRCTNPVGSVHIRFATGMKQDRPALVWETTVQSSQDDVPEMPDGFEGWIDAAHSITGDWFFKLINGDLLECFK